MAILLHPDPRPSGKGSAATRAPRRKSGFKSMFSLFKEAASEWSEDKASRLAAALSYYTIFSIAPLLIIAISVAGLVFGQEAASDQIFGRDPPGHDGGRGGAGHPSHGAKRRQQRIGDRGHYYRRGHPADRRFGRFRTVAGRSQHHLGGQTETRSRGEGVPSLPFPVLLHGARHRVHADGFPGGECWPRWARRLSRTYPFDSFPRPCRPSTSWFPSWSRPSSSP